MTGKKTLQKLNQTYTQKELSNIFNVSVRTIQRWKKDGFPKKSPLQKQAEQIKATGELIKRKRSKAKIRQVVDTAKDSTLLTKENKTGSKKYLVVQIPFANYVSVFKNNLETFRKETISQWFPFYKNYRFMYLKGFLFRLDLEETNRPLELVGSVITKTRNSDEINASLSDFIEKVINFIANYQSSYKIDKISISFINLK